ncbi:hypothetical protein V501_03323 [Pseudogymnoascus sp. VKM F-4519 (FW-2642)]|nr:hypothetical protein V501_03323 [Pseudogymnoascus sp. VKM F-4519 (FW-2642)]
MRYYYSLFGSWAGENIVCASDEILPGDYPPGLFSAKEEEDMDKKFLVLIYGSDGYYDDSDFEYGEGGEDGAEQLTLHNLSKSPGTCFYEEFFVERESTRVFCKAARHVASRGRRSLTQGKPYCGAAALTEGHGVEIGLGA